MSKSNDNIFAHRKRRRTNRRRRRSILFASLIVLFGLIAISRWFAGVAREVDLVANVSYFVAPLALLIMAFALIRRRWMSSVCLLTIALMAGWPILDSIMADYRTSARSSRDVTPTSAIISVLVINADGNAEALDRLAQLLQQSNPELVAIIEAGQETGRAFVERDDIAEIYPYRVEPDRSIFYSIALLSRHPLTRLTFDDDPSTIDEETYAWHHSYLVDLPNDARIVFTAAHPPSPRSRDSWQRGNKKIEAVAHLVRTRLAPPGHPVILAGDFNTTATGYRHRLMHAQSGLVSSDELIGGIQGTWPARFPAFLRLALDRVWVSPAQPRDQTPDQLHIMSREVLDDIGSDHRPVLFRLMVE